MNQSVGMDNSRIELDLAVLERSLASVSPKSRKMTVSVSEVSAALRKIKQLRTQIVVLEARNEALEHENTLLSLEGSQAHAYYQNWRRDDFETNQADQPRLP